MCFSAVDGGPCVFVQLVLIGSVFFSAVGVNRSARFSAVDADRVHVLHVAHVQHHSESVTKNIFLSVYWQMPFILSNHMSCK